MKGESCVSRRILDQLRYWDIQGDKKEGERNVSRSIIDELHSSAIEGDQMES